MREEIKKLKDRIKNKNNEIKILKERIKNIKEDAYNAWNSINRYRLINEELIKSVPIKIYHIEYRILAHGVVVLTRKSLEKAVNVGHLEIKLQNDYYHNNAVNYYAIEVKIIDIKELAS